MKPKSRSTQNDRIRDAMIAAGIHSPVELARRLGLPRQTVHRWLDGNIKNITYENLFRLADLLDVSARWLAIGDVDPSKYLVKNELEVEMMSVMREMPLPMRVQWLSIGRSLLSLRPEGEGNRVNPFPRSKSRSS